MTPAQAGRGDTSLFCAAAARSHPAQPAQRDALLFGARREQGRRPMDMRLGAGHAVGKIRPDESYGLRRHESRMGFPSALTRSQISSVRLRWM